MSQYQKLSNQWGVIKGDDKYVKITRGVCLNGIRQIL